MTGHKTEGEVFQGNLKAEAGRVYDYKRVTSYISASSGKIEAGAFPKQIKTNDTEAANKCRAMLLSSFAAAGFSFADGILARIVSQRGPVTRVVICGRTEVSFLVTDGEAWSHGKTLAEARDGLLYKIGNRDTTEFKKWTMDSVVTKRDAIRAYRTITGACEGGVREWMEQQGETPDTITVQRVVNMTKGAYGADTFREFFKS